MYEYNFSLLLNELKGNFGQYLRPFQSKELVAAVKRWLGAGFTDIQEVNPSYA